MTSKAQIGSMQRGLKNRKFDKSILIKFQNYDTTQLTANKMAKRREALRKFQEGID